MNSLAKPPFIPQEANAPFTREQIAWLNGFLAGLYSGQGDATSTVDLPKAAPTVPVSILWGSQTGNSEGVARKLAKALKEKGMAPTVYDMGEYEGQRLKEETNVLIVTSTYGDGEPPDNAAALHGWLASGEASRLESLRYAVFALGDTNYPDFCKCGIEFDQRLAALGAQPLTPRVDCDVEFEAAFENWLSAVQAALGAPAANASSERHDSASASLVQEYGKQRPFEARVVENRSLNGLGSAKETRHVELSLAGSGLSYEPGDALAVLPRNDPAYVDELLRLAGFDGEEKVELEGGGNASLRKTLLEQRDITSLSAKTIVAYATLVGQLELLALAEDKERCREYSWGRQFIDLLIEHPHSFATAGELLAVLPKLAPRLYSISSSMRANAEAVHVTVGAVRYNAHGRERRGVCSNFLADLPIGATASIYFHASKTFKLPADGSVPVIMVGPGTGIAPFRAFLQERQSSGARGRNWLFFGDQRAACDFLYREELEAYVQSGCLTRLDTAFSRDQAEKVYVQDRMRAAGAELFAWLEEGAHFYVCGDASRMAKDVDAALRAVISEFGSVSVGDADAYVDRLKKEKRYLRDVY